MTIKRLVTHPDAGLREGAVPVTPETLGLPATQALIDDMVDTMRKQDGAGLAANQVGSRLAICVIEGHSGPRLLATVLVNPQIIRSRGRYLLVESCLSVICRPLRTPRHRSIWVRALNRYGRPQAWKGIGGRFAHVIQHEVDHLNGRLYIDSGVRSEEQDSDKDKQQQSTD